MVDFMAIPHNSKCRCGEREVQAAKQKAQMILCVLSSIFAKQIVLRSRGSGAQTIRRELHGAALAHYIHIYLLHGIEQGFTEGFVV